MIYIRQDSPNKTSKIRILHGVPQGPNVDVYANGTIIARDVAFGIISEYFELSSGNYEIQLYKTGYYDSPLLSQNLQISPGSNYTVSAITLSGTLFLFKLRDAAISTSITSSYLRFINLSPNSPLLSLTLPNDIEIFDTVEYLETTGYYQLSPGMYNFKVVLSAAEGINKNIKNLSLENGKLYTIYVIGLFNNKPPIGYLFVEDSK